MALKYLPPICFLKERLSFKTWCLLIMQDLLINFVLFYHQFSESKLSLNNGDVHFL